MRVVFVTRCWNGTQVIRDLSRNRACLRCAKAWHRGFYPRGGLTVSIESVDCLGAMPLRSMGMPASIFYRLMVLW
ncbi:MAG: hypothetical protein Fues2KO_40350 [Fuerstiella sp.]